MGSAGMSAIFALLSLLLAFLSSIRGASAMEFGGVLIAEYVITNGVVLKMVCAELFVYVSLFFFLVSISCYIGMEYSGPSFCPSYRGSASMCSRIGQAFYK